MIKITYLHAIEILDSRGRPTVAATLGLADGAVATVSIPSGTSTGKAEAKELRDRLTPYQGLGCRKAVENIQGTIARAVVGHEFLRQEDLDLNLNAIDGTPDKSRLGANAILATSLAFARASAVSQGIELYEYFAHLLPEGRPELPRLTVNLFSGGKHAFGQVAIQDVLVVPASGWSVAASLAMIYDIYQAAAEIVVKQYRTRPLRADEGGLAPPFATSVEMLERAAESIESAGYELGRDVSLAIDVAASHFVQEDGRYRIDERILVPEELIDLLGHWKERFPLISIEDGLSEDDWDHWPALRERLGEETLTLADDLTCTNPDRIARAIRVGAANALLLKMNQIGTVTEAKQACLLARQAGWKVTVSARSGETEDTWLADLATGWSGDFIKVGSITQSERLAKYNRLLMIEDARDIP
jgi:enolase